MGLIERRQNLKHQIEMVEDEEILEMLESILQYYIHPAHADITDGLDAIQLKELSIRMHEPGEKNTISEEAFSTIFARWDTR